jgi:hypothetical protein
MAGETDSQHTSDLKDQLAASKALDGLDPDSKMALIQQYLRKAPASVAQLTPSSFDSNPLSKFIPVNDDGIPAITPQKDQTPYSSGNSLLDKVMGAIIPSASASENVPLGSGKNLEVLQRARAGATQAPSKYPSNITQDALAERQGFKQVSEPYTTEGVLVPEGTSVPALRQNTLPTGKSPISPNGWDKIEAGKEAPKGWDYHNPPKTAAERQAFNDLIENDNVSSSEPLSAEAVADSAGKGISSEAALTAILGMKALSTPNLGGPDEDEFINSQAQNDLHNSAIKLGNTGILPSSTSGLPPYTPNQLQALSKQSSGEPKGNGDTTSVDLSSPPSNGSDNEDLADNTPANKTPEQLALDNGTSKYSASGLGLKGQAKEIDDTDEDNDEETTPSKSSPNQSVSKPLSPQEQFNQRLQNAAQGDADRQLLFGMLKASQMFGNALGKSNHPADTSYADAQLAQHNLLANQIKTQMDVQEEFADIQQKTKLRDPNSPISNFYQSAIKELSPNFKSDGMSAEDLQKAFPQIEGIVSKKLALAQQQAYHDQLIKNQQMGLDIKQQNADTAEAKANAIVANGGNKLVQNYAKDRDVMLAPRGSPLGQEVRKVTQATHSLDFLNNVSDLNDATPLQKQDLALTFATMLSPTGTPDVQTIRHMNEQGVNDYLASAVQRITGSPAATNTAGLTKQLKDAIVKQRQVSMNFVNQHQDTVDEKYASQIQANPDQFKAIMDKTNLSSRSSRFFPNAQQTNSTINSNPAVSSGPVTVRRKSDGAVKTLPADTAQKYLASPDFERVQ